MLVLPVGLEQNEVRRVPWVSATIIVLCFLVQILLSIVFSGAHGEASRDVGEAVQYLAEHPYLSAEPALTSLLREDVQAELERLRSQASTVPLSNTLVAEEQRQLNELTRDALAAVRGLPSFRFGFIAANPRLHTLVTSAFVHAGWFHLLGNMLFLFLSGPFIEDLYGRPLFAGLYATSAVVAIGAFAISEPESTVPLVGASGAIAGVMGAFLWRLARRRIRFLVLPIPIVPAWRYTLTLPAFVVLPLWALQQVYYASGAGAGTSVAFSAHVGGFAAGLVFAAVVSLLQVEETVVAPAIEKEISLEQNPAIERASEARTSGDLATARREIAAALRDEPDNLDAWIESWEIALECGDTEAAGRSGLRLLDLLRRRSEKELLYDLLTDRRWRALQMPPRFTATVADLFARQGDGREAIDLYRRISSELEPSDPVVLRALVSEGELLARAGDVAGAQRAFERARAHPGCSDLWIERIDAALGVTPPRQDAPRPRHG
jgi:membrane associated rhomboid family serine protease